MDLASPEAFSRIELEDSDFLGGPKVGGYLEWAISVGIADADNCFHRLRLEGDICKFFCCPPLPASTFNITCVDGTPISSQQLIWPMQLTLPMGFSWATHLAQEANSHQLSMCLRSQPSHCISDPGQPWVISNIQQCNSHYVYIDNVGVMSNDLPYVSKRVGHIKQHFGEAGLWVQG